MVGGYFVCCSGWKQSAVAVPRMLRSAPPFGVVRC
jgi:hypothetical protein